MISQQFLTPKFLVRLQLSLEMAIGQLFDRPAIKISQTMHHAALSSRHIDESNAVKFTFSDRLVYSRRHSFACITLTSSKKVADD
jgi:hypothetical protein